MALALNDRRVHIASPVYHRADLLPKKTGLTFAEFLLVRFQPGVSTSARDSLIKQLGTEDISGEPNLLGDDLRHLRILDLKQRHALEVADQFAQSSLVRYAGPDWCQLHPAINAVEPNDEYFENQWHLARIGAPDGWELSTGDPSIVIAILDGGCHLAHEDLAPQYVPQDDWCDLVLDTDGAEEPEDWDGHGTCCAGVAAAASDNDELGVAGVAWRCRIMPIRMMVEGWGWERWVIRALGWARWHGADVVNMSWTWDGIRDSINLNLDTLHSAGIVLVATTGNDDISSIGYPASHPPVIAVGATNQDDERVSPTSTDQCWWGSQWGPELSVMAPGVSIWTTDIYDDDCEGYNIDGEPWTLTEEEQPCLGPEGTYTYPTTGDTLGRYCAYFGGTSAAAPQVAGLAALLRSLYPSLSNDEVRLIIEKTAEKVGGYTYAYDPDHPSSTWNEEMGYGRINVYRALDFADVYIKDHPDDDGSVPFSGNFYGHSDIVVRHEDDDVFEHEPARQNWTNYIYVRVTNLGPAVARNVTVSVCAAPYVRTEFVYPDDWVVTEGTQVGATPIEASFEEVLVGEDEAVIAKFSLSASQIDVLYGWEMGHWHPCLLAEVRCENDYGAISEGVRAWENNNLAQRNITTVWSEGPGGPDPLPFIMGHRRNPDLYMELVIDRSTVPQEVALFLDPWDTKPYFPALKPPPPETHRGITFLDRTRLALSLCGCDGILTLEAGSTFECGTLSEEDIFLQGAAFVQQDGKRLIAIREDQAVVGLKKRPGEMRQMSLKLRVPDEARPSGSYHIDVRQRNTKQEVVGGATFVVKTAR